MADFIIPIIYGTRKKEYVIGRFGMRCKGCEIPWAHRAIVNKKVATLFYLPIIPMGSHRYVRCENCNNVIMLSPHEEFPMPEMSCGEAIRVGAKILAERSKKDKDSDDRR